MKAQPPLLDVYWIGGSVCAGKSSIVRTWAGRWDVIGYHFDEREREHLTRSGITAEILEYLPVHERQRRYDRRWLERSPEEMAARTIRSWRARFPLVLEDLSRVPAGRRLTAEGAGLFPELVAPLLLDKSTGIWLIATPEFIRWARFHRGMTAPRLTSDPTRAAENIIARDILVARWVGETARDFGLTTLKIDGSESMADVGHRVSSHFGFEALGELWR